MQIEKGVPIPPTVRGRPLAPIKIPFDAMQVGDSVLVVDEQGVSENLASLVKVRAHRHAKKTGRMYQSMKIGADVRIWRIE